MNGKVIINADDFGLTQGVNAAIFDLAHLGTISATNVMVNMPYMDSICELAKNVPNLSIGLHLNLTQGKPVSPSHHVPTLVNAEGDFYPFALLKKRLRQISDTEVRREIEAQYLLANRLLGDRLDHWNSHQGIHRFQPILRIASEIGYKRGVRWVRTHRHFFTEVINNELHLRYPNILSLGKFRLKRILTEIYYDNSARGLSRYFALPDGLMTSDEGGTTTVLELAARYPLPNGLWEIPCHPAISTDALAQTNMVESRVREFQLLSSRYFQQLLSKDPAKLIGYNSSIA